MSTTIHVGKARVFDFSVRLGGVVDTTTSVTPSSGNDDNLRVTVNPSNPRQFAAVALGVTPGVNANISIANSGLSTAQALIVIVAADAPPTPDGITIDEAGVGPEIDPPSWA